MSPISITLKRTVGMARNLYSSALSIGAFLSGVAVLFAFNLERGEGGSLSLAAIWTSSVSPILPALAAFLAMDVWSDERHTGRIDVLLSSPVLERDYVIGKFLGVFIMTMGATLFSLFLSLGELFYFAPSLVSATNFYEFLPGLFALSLQGALFASISVAMSALFKHAAASACASLVAMIALPRGVWEALIAWSTGGGSGYGAMPLDAQALNFASGIYDLGVIAGYLILTLAMLFISTRSIVALRFRGRNAYAFRVSTGFIACLTLILSVILVILAVRLGPTFDIPLSGQRRFSERTRNIIAESHGDISVTAFLPRSDAKAREIELFFKALSETSVSLSGAKFSYRIVDPAWDRSQAERLIRRGAKERSLIFESKRSFVPIAIDDGFDERRIASAISRFTKPISRQTIYWTRGHKELSYAEYGPWGMSEIARDLANEGYHHLVIDLANENPIPSDCALLVVAGAKTEFSRSEIAKVEQYLKSGGRLLLLMDSEEGGVSSLLPGWGILASRGVFKGSRTMSGTDVVVDDFSNHVIAEPLKGSQIVLETPLVFERSSAAKFEGGADKLEYSVVASNGEAALVVAIERGAMLGEDLAIRPTRIVAIGDASFVLNGQIAARRNANRDFFLNAVAYLSGSDTAAGNSQEWNQLTSRMDRKMRIDFTFLSAFVVPGTIFILMMLMVARRRHRQ